MNILNKKSNEQLKKYVDGLPTPPDKLVRSLLPAPIPGFLCVWYDRY